MDHLPNQQRPQSLQERLTQFMLNHELESYSYCMSYIVALENQLELSKTEYDKLQKEVQQFRKELEELKANATYPDSNQNPA